MKQFMLDFWEDTKDMAKANPWKTAMLIVVSAGIGFALGSF